MKTARTYFADKGEANGRMYDPVMSSFLSVDRYVQNPSNSQNFNRYAYCMNNPLKYVAPSGWQMVGGTKPRPWSYGNNLSYEPRDFQDGSPVMINYNLGSGGGGFAFGGGGSSVSYGFAVNNPQYSVEQQCALIRKWQKDPSWLNRWMMQKAGLSDINRGEVYVNGIRNTYLSWEYNGVSHTASVENEYVGGRGLWGQTVSDIGGRGSYMPPGYVYSSFDNAGSGLSGLQKASVMAQSLGVPMGTITEGFECAAKSAYGIPLLKPSSGLTSAQKVSVLTKEGAGLLKTTKFLGNGCAVASVSISGIMASGYYLNGGTGLEVGGKFIADAFFAAVGIWGGPIGLLVCTGYMIADWATDGFGVSYEIKP